MEKKEYRAVIDWYYVDEDALTNLNNKEKKSWAKEKKDLSEERRHLKAALAFLLKNSNIVSFRIVDGAEKQPRFDEMFSHFRTEFIKRVEQRDSKGYSYGGVEYYFKLSKKIKDIFNKQGLFWPRTLSKWFYFFEDPVFYKNNEKVAYVVEHEDEIYFYISESEREYLKSKGIKL